MQSAQAQYSKQALANAVCNLNETVGSLIKNITDIVFILENQTSTQIDVKIEPISSKMQSVNDITRRVQDALDTLGACMKNTRASESLKQKFFTFYCNLDRVFRFELNTFCAEMDSLLMIALCQHNDVELPGVGAAYEERASSFANHFITRCKSLEAGLKICIAEISNDIEAFSTQEARAHADQESEKMVTQSQIRKREAWQQSLGDEPVSSKCQSDTQPVIAESAYKPDTTLSSATLSSAESKVGPTCNIL